MRLPYNCSNAAVAAIGKLIRKSSIHAETGALLHRVDDADHRPGGNDA